MVRTIKFIKYISYLLYYTIHLKLSSEDRIVIDKQVKDTY